MSRTTRCLFAIGLSVSLAAACGDDDDDGFGVGGTGGRAGGGGSGGRAGAAGAAGASGAAGAAGDAGSSGTGGDGGTGGSNGGTGGSNGGTGGTEPVDAGADATADGGDEPTDAGPAPIACNFEDDDDDGIIDVTEDADGAGTQGVIITRIVFVGANAQVTFRAINDDFNFAPPLQLCTGSEQEDCDPGVDELGAELDDGGIADLPEGEEVTYTTALGDIVTAASGELALVNGSPENDEEPIIRAYVRWGDYVSLPPTVGDNDDLATEAEEEGVWVAEDSVDVNGQTTIYAVGDVTDENGFEVCTED